MKNQNEIIKSNNIKLKKSLGQNFLKDENIIKKIINVADIDSTDNIIEIGPGAGALTSLLLPEVNKLLAIEIDSNLYEYLKQEFQSEKKFDIINKDFLKISDSELENLGNDVKVVANLPYYITSAIITKILLEFDFIKEIYIMVQKEVAERITSEPKNRAYGSLSVFCQSLCEVKYEFTVSKNVFIPAPKVDSAIISLKRKGFNDDIISFQKFVKNCFKQKRKTLVNNINNCYGIEKEKISFFLMKQGFDEKIRSEHITVEQFLTLYIEFAKKFQGVL